MESKTPRYHIIDEPKATKWDFLVMNPMVIIFATMIVPIIWAPPFAGRYWVPLVWICVNGYIMGSATFKREVVTCLVGCLALLAVFIGFAQIPHEVIENTTIGWFNYLRLALNTILFLTLLLAAFSQMKSFSLFQYIGEGRE
ncbi:hypothetical protein [Thaumasiovibrio subtropicus]|uniref:hypothetical protein n=1 Tax=Thaumasiovibrio subtropicus TaxID=1891207 RepID=UPI000B34F23A|nr:hypothetical protein [Thaumasiovibrio subtropicus]